MSEFYTIIRPLRMLKGVKQEEIAIMLNVTQQSVSKIERGLTIMKDEVADRIAVYLGFKHKADMEKFYADLTPPQEKLQENPQD